MRRSSRVFAKGVALSLLAFLVGGIVNYLFRRVLAGALPRADYGFFFSAYALGILAATLIGGGFQQAVVALVPKYNATGDRPRAAAIFGLSFIVWAAGGLLTGLAMAAGGHLLLAHYFRYPAAAWPFALFCVFVPATTVFFGMLSGASGFKDFTARNVIQVTQFVLMLLATLPWLRTHGLFAASAALLGSTAVTAIAAAMYLERRHRLFSIRTGLRPDVVAETWQFARWGLASVTGMLLLQSLDTLLLTRLSGLHSVAIYNIALPLQQVFLIASVVPVVFAPIASDLWHRGKQAELMHAVSLVVRALSAWGVIIVLFIIPSSRQMVGLFFGAGFEDAALPLTVLTVAVPFFVIAQFFVNVLLAVQRPGAVAVAVSAAVAVDAAANVALIPRAGAAGAACATVAGQVVLMAASYAMLRRHTTVRLLQRHTIEPAAKGLLCIAVAIGAVFLTRRAAPLSLSALLILVYALISRHDLRGLWREGWHLARGRAAPHPDAPAPEGAA